MAKHQTRSANSTVHCVAGLSGSRTRGGPPSGAAIDTGFKALAVYP